MDCSPNEEEAQRLYTCEEIQLKDAAEYEAFRKKFKRHTKRRNQYNIWKMGNSIEKLKKRIVVLEMIARGQNFPSPQISVSGDTTIKVWDVNGDELTEVVR